MPTVSLYGLRPRTFETYDELLEHRQWKHPFCKKVDNNNYMESVRKTYRGLSRRDIREGDIDISSAEAFVRSLVRLGEAEILAE